MIVVPSAYVLPREAFSTPVDSQWFARKMGHYARGENDTKNAHETSLYDSGKFSEKSSRGT